MQHLPTALCSRVSSFEERSRNSRPVGRSARVSSLSWFSSKKQHPACPLLLSPLPSFTSLSFSPFLQLPHFTKLPNEGTCHLYTSSVSWFAFPPLPPLSLALPRLPLEPVRIVTVLPPPLDAAGLTGRGEGPESPERPACTLAMIGKEGGGKKKQK